MTQTFLPYEDFEKSAAVLDNKRLNSSINEGYEAYIFNLGNPNNKPIRHPNGHCIFRLWGQYETVLRIYLQALIREAKSRSMQPMDTEWFTDLEPELVSKPEWLGSPIFHELYQRHLVSKDFEYYKKYFHHQVPISGYLAPMYDGCWHVYSSQYDKTAERKIKDRMISEITYPKSGEIYDREEFIL
jgi:hypothetical protein